MTTQEAFKEMIKSPSVWKSLGISQERIKYFRHRIKYKKPIETDKMEELLIKSGWTIKQEKLWNKP
jgi:hypothetical protein